MVSLIAIVDENDKIIGYSDKHDVHKSGVMHRAFSIFVFNASGQVLLHRRAFDKYHSSGLWTNTCCSHLSKGMQMDKAIHLRLIEEMGFDTELKYVRKFHYRVEFNNGMVENEIDHIYVGLYNKKPKPNPSEVSGYKWVTPNELIDDINKNPNAYTYWLKHIMMNHYSSIENALQQLLVTC